MFKLLLALALASTAYCQCIRSEDKYIGDLCYRISNQKFGFQDAALACHEFGLNLAVIKTTFQANFLASMVGAQSGGSDKTFWIGLSRASVSSRFTWDDGSNMYWSNFDMNLPKTDLFVAESITNGKWQTLDGSQQLYYVCSYDPKYVTPGTATPGYPGSTQDYPASSRGYPASTPGYPASSRGYPASTQGYPASSRGYPASSNAPYTRGPYSTGYPASQNPSGAPVTGYPVSYPASDSTGYPASQMPSGAPVTGYPASQRPSGAPFSDSTGSYNTYPASQTPSAAPFSDSTGSYPGSQRPSGAPASFGTGSPVSDSTGYPGSVQPSDSTGYPMSSAPQ